MNKIIVFTTADVKNEEYARMLENSFKKFHPDIEFHTVKGEELQDYLKADPNFFYRQKPILMKKYLEAGYTLVVGMDCDQIVTGKMSEIFDYQDYGIAVVHNWNRVDPPKYGEVGLASIAPQEYFNCGLVAVRDFKFVLNWYSLCFSKHFDRTPFREQGLLNLVLAYGNYQYKDLDGFNNWYGIASKGEWNKAQLVTGEQLGTQMFIPANEQTNYPDRTKEIKVIHWGGGNSEVKMNYKVFFNEECIKYLDYLTSDEKTETKE